MTEVAALVLAAGRASRFGAGPDDSKVLALIDGKPLVRHVVEAALASRARPVIVVTGHAGGKVRAALDGLPVQIVDNPDYAAGMSGSLQRGVAALPEESGGAVVLLADMPRVSAALIDRLIAAFEDGAVRPAAVAPTFGGKRGNPVLIGGALFAAVAGLSGDVGARPLLQAAGAALREIAVDDDSVLVDVDTRAALDSLAFRQSR